MYFYGISLVFLCILIGVPIIFMLHLYGNCVYFYFIPVDF